MKIIQTFVFATIAWIYSVEGQSRKCCAEISVTSNSVGGDYQAHQLGIYTMKENLTVNGRPVYKQVGGDQYIYYWVSKL